MSDLFTIDCHACGAKNTIDTETMRRADKTWQDYGYGQKVEISKYMQRCGCPVCVATDEREPEPAA